MRHPATAWGVRGGGGQRPERALGDLNAEYEAAHSATGCRSKRSATSPPAPRRRFRREDNSAGRSPSPAPCARETGSRCIVARLTFVAPQQAARRGNRRRTVTLSDRSPTHYARNSALPPPLNQAKSFCCSRLRSHSGHPHRHSAQRRRREHRTAVVSAIARGRDAEAAHGRMAASTRSPYHGCSRAGERGALLCRACRALALPLHAGHRRLGATVMAARDR